MQVLDTQTIVLDGTHLIEASAGTGKTYTITTLLLRLIAEGDGLPINAVCVVTFTEAATAELRERIRSRIKEALDVLRGDRDTDDPLLCAYAALPIDERELRLARLQQALSCFDEAAIYTIHGFCRRLLCDFAYESGLQFETELITAQDRLVQEAVDDFWRLHAAGASLLLSDYLLEQKLSPDRLKDTAARVLRNPLMRVVPEAAPVETAGPERCFAESFAAASRMWGPQREELKALLTTSSSLHKGTYKPASINAWFDGLDAFFKAPEPLSLPPVSLEKFSLATVQNKCKKDCQPPEHPFFETAQKLWDASVALRGRYEQYCMNLKIELCRCIRRALTQRKREQNVQFFDDLLLRVRESLDGPGGAGFAQRVRNRFRAALIDEFQDTDQLQYEIFKRIFNYPDTALFFIGDPKQAIYSFRSADVFTYLEACDDVAGRHTLTTNWRSTPELIRALELLFEEHSSPFVLNRIPFVAVEPSGDERASLLINGRRTAPLQLRVCACGKQRGKKTEITTPLAGHRICADVAAEIAALLDGRAVLGTRELQAGDIAVLVRTHKQAGMVQTALHEQGIACVVQNSGNLFATPEAIDMALVLSGIAAPEYSRLVRSALATELLGFSAAQLYAMDETSGQWVAELERFNRLNRLWHTDGFSAMLRLLLIEYRVLPRLVALPGGERRVTNVLHVAEVLQDRSTQTGSGMWELQRWFAGQLSAEQESGDEYLLRLESDRRAVNIMTMHKSKGLEFEVVFCPFSWNGSVVKGTGFEYHESDSCRALDLGSERIEENRQQAEREQLAENIRLLYVALTRARQRCYLYWGALPGAETSAPAWLLHNRDDAGTMPGLDGVKNTFLELGDEDILAAAERLSARAPDCIQVRSVQPADETSAHPAAQQIQEQQLCCREFNGRMQLPWRITSFSGFISGRVHEAEVQERDSDNHVDDPVVSMPSPGVMSLPPGATTGTMLHAVLENCSFPSRRDRELDELVSETLASYQFDPVWHDVVADIVCRTATQPLPGIGGSFCLADLDAGARVPELAFHLPLRRTAPHNLQALFAGHAITGVPGGFADSLGRLTFSPVHGFLKGFIDSVVLHAGRFYLIDWKSNLLGTDPADYHRERLGTVMARDYYVLQYHLYALALHAYLERRVPHYSYDENFGGIFYVFLRGLQPDGNPDYGVYYDRPDSSFIQEMARALIDTGADHGH
jgi:exodeoxyribonuclease V beta subunit